MKDLRITYCFFVVFLSYILSFSQSSVKFQQLSGENISTQSITYAVKQDSAGNVWIGSEEGVLKHNSKFYKVYNTYNGLPSLFSNRTYEVFIDSKERIWIGLERGVGIYDKDLDVFKIVNSNIDINPSLIKSITEDEENNIWIASFNGLWKYGNKNENKKLILVDDNQDIQDLESLNNQIIYGTPKGLFVYNKQHNNSKQILLDKHQNNIRTIELIDSFVYVGTDNGKLFKLNQELKIVDKINLKTPITHPITDIVKNDSGNFYISTDGDGLFQFSSDFLMLNHWKEDSNNANSLSSNGIYDILLGKENILWLATYGGGISYIDFNQLPFNNIIHRFNDKESLVANFTRSIAKDTNGNLWFGTKKGISIWNQKTNIWTHIPNMESNLGKAEDIVLALEPDDQYMWVGTYNNGVFKININNLTKTHYNKLNNELLDKVYTITKDSKGNIWVGGVDGKLAVINPDDAIRFYPIQQIKSIYETKSGYILAAGRYGVYKIKPSTGEFELIEGLKPDTNTLAYSTINNLVEDENEQLIIATNGEGIVFYDPKTKKVKTLTLSSGMPSDIVQAVLAQSSSNIWASTTKGLVNIKLTSKDTIINVFDKKDGLASTEFNYGSYNKINDSLFAFGGVNGITFFNPNHIKENNSAPDLVFDEFKLFNKKINPSEGPLKKHINEIGEVVLKHNENSIEILFTGILHSSASKIKYTYKLEGFDDIWSKPSLSNQATYTNLPNGNYIFKAKAINKYGTTSKEKQLKIQITSPWWATNKAYAFYVFLVILLVYIVIHFTSVIIKKKHADEQIDFFNNITHEIKTPLTILISSLDNVTESNATGEESKNRIKTTVKRINSLFEQMLNFQKFTSEDKLSMDISKIDLDQHLKMRINNFMPLTKERKLEIIVDNDWDEQAFYFDKDILDKILLNLISNAIKYSFENGNIYINLYKTKMRELKIEIIDQGLGIPKDQQKFILKRYYRARNAINSQRPGTGLGLMMVKKLLEKTEGTINFQSEENKGTKFTIVLKNLKFEFDKNTRSNETNVNNIDAIEEEQSELNDYSDSKILIVEDNDELREVLVNTLGTYFQIFEASNGNEGLENASQIFPDIILTDLIMPEMDGMQMAKKLKDDINLNHIPVFMLTVLQNSAQKLESIEAGISEYIEKPIDIKFLLAKIINSLKWQQKLREKYIHDNDADNALLFRNKNDQEFVKNLEDIIVKNIENNSYSVHDLAKGVGMSRTSLYMKLKNLVDLSPQDFIIHARLKFAKNLLIKGTSSIKEVAYSSGFSNPKYFSTSFKKFYGTTPSGFIDNLRKTENL